MDEKELAAWISVLEAAGITYLLRGDHSKPKVQQLLESCGLMKRAKDL